MHLARSRSIVYFFQNGRHLRVIHFLIQFGYCLHIITIKITNSLVFPSISINDGNIVSVIGIIVIGSVFN